MKCLILLCPRTEVLASDLYIMDGAKTVVERNIGLVELLKKRDDDSALHY